MPLNYQNNVFKELVEKYSTWDDMRNYLESEEGGLLELLIRMKRLDTV